MPKFLYYDCMTWTQRRKFIYTTIMVLAVSGATGFFLYDNLKKEPTCFDGKKNSTEEGIDCGGQCARICEGQSRNIVVLWARPFEVAPGVYNVVAYFENQNTGAGIAQVQYEFKLYDKENVLVAEPFRGTTFIGPNQRSAIFASGIQTGNRVPETVFFHFLQQPQWDLVDQTFASPLIIARDQVYQDLGTSAKITATLNNTSFYDLQSIPVVVIAYDAMGNAIASSQTYVERITQGGNVPVVFTWQKPFEQAPARIEVVPRINPFLPHGRR